ncbi:rod shape-determining protein MreD [Pacificibacter maritimus]|uniref:Rod shape-determining protein MreD n=1 Tax=Pacificibacter maritimus TaxID=762213 RepID=A0A3N4UAE9_9RHOB|nr:rod shape-determining protein MreD [Pacificibacter maritimus]RPE67452.1 rod shape-determining protein MreD [Pacificibacter maritimus]
MGEYWGVKKWAYRCAFVLLSLVALFIYLLPLEFGEGRWPGPDLIVAFAFAWVLRRPSYVPILLIGPVFLIADFMLVRPPGLWAALCVLGIEFLRRREGRSRDIPFPVEWAMISAVLLGLAVIYRVLLSVFLVQQASFGLVILQQLSTLFIYPLVVFISTSVMGVTKITAAEAEVLGFSR